MKTRHYLILGLCLLMAACEQGNAPTEKNTTLIKPFNNGYALYYGACYGHMGIDTPVFEMNLYTDRLGIDSTGRYTGTGTHLYLSDIFVPIGSDTILPPGRYQMDTTHSCRPYSIMAGELLGGFHSGSYAATVSDMAIIYDYITAGTMTVEAKADGLLLTFDLHTRNGHHIQSRYEGKLPHADVSERGRSRHGLRRKRDKSATPTALPSE